MFLVHLISLQSIVVISNVDEMCDIDRIIFIDDSVHIVDKSF